MQKEVKITTAAKPQEVVLACRAAAKQMAGGQVLVNAQIANAHMAL